MRRSSVKYGPVFALLAPSIPGVSDPVFAATNADAFRRTVNLLRTQRATLERGARKLLEHETLDEADLAALLREAEPVAD